MEKAANSFPGKTAIVNSTGVAESVEIPIHTEVPDQKIRISNALTGERRT
jgi:hypothetical protein